MSYIEFNCLPTMIGSMPQKDPAEACEQVAHYLKEIPAWPQLSNRSFSENMYAQYSEGFPGITIKNDSIFVDRSQDLNKPLENLYANYLAGDIDKFAISREHAAGLHEFLSLRKLAPPAVKGQIVGPVSWGMTVTDNDKRSIVYDDTLADAAAKMLRMKAAWQERELSRVSGNTIIFVDEPYMSSFGSAFFALSKEKVITLLEEVLGGIRGLKGIHCCGNTDWSVLLQTSANILSFDAYGYAESLSLYPNEVKRFIANKGAIAWGIVPNELDVLNIESVGSLKDRLEEAMAPFTRNGIRFRQLIEQGLLTPSCGLSRLPNAEACARAFELLNDLSRAIRKRYL
jgi:methionine synthase II (cobalamin-independent)